MNTSPFHTAVLRTLSWLTRITISVLVAATLPTGQAAAQPKVKPTAELKTMQVPPVDTGANSLRARRAAQLRTINRFKVYHDFQFTDRQPASGLNFKHRPVPDGEKEYKMVHYDHGNGIAVADVDADGRYDVYLVNQLGNNELWRNLGGGRFENKTEAAGIALGDRVSVAASFADFDNDGDPDLFVTTVKMGNVLFENDGKGRFKDITKKAGVETSAHSSGAVFFDYDRDGLLDLFVTNVGVYTSDSFVDGYYVGLPDAFQGHLTAERTEHNQLFRNLGNGRFADVSKESGIEDGSWSGDASFADLNGDNYPDLYVPNMQGDDHYYENDKGRRFVDRTKEFFPKTPWGAMGIKFFDYNNDGGLDLILTDMHSDMSREVDIELEQLKSVITWKDEYLQGGANNIFGNAFFEATGDGHFVEKSDLLGLENYWPWGVSVGDLNADGFQDVFITASMNYPYHYQINSVLLNNRGEEFLGSEFILGIEPRRDGKTHIPWFKTDCSGADREHVSCKNREGQYQVLGALGTRSVAIYDLDDDGDLDMVTHEFHTVPQVLISNLAEKTQPRFVKIKLVGKASNRDGLGARVEVTAGGKVLMRYNDGKSGYLTQSSLPLYFGLGEAKKIDRIEVLWPLGQRQTVDKGLTINSLIEIEEEGAAPSS